MSSPHQSLPSRGVQAIKSQVRTVRTRAAGRRNWLQRGGFEAWRVSQELAPRHCEPTIAASTLDRYNDGQDVLVDVLLRAAHEARSIDMSSVLACCATQRDSQYVNTWPGEHYRLLAAVTQVLDVSLAIEVGTYTGLGALCVAQGADCVVTYDIIPHTDFRDSALKSPSVPANIEQRIGDLSDAEYFRSQADVLSSADLIFIDGPKDGVFEKVFGELLYRAIQGNSCLVIWDDIHLLQMQTIWQDFPVIKLDATSLGHWSGTGMTTSYRATTSE